MKRRRFLKYVLAAAAASALGSATLEYFDVSKILRGSPISVSTTNSKTSTVSTAGLPADYQGLLDWLSSVSKPFAGQVVNIAFEDEASARAIQRRDVDFFNATRINSQYDLRPYSQHLQEISLMVRTQAPTFDVFSVDYQDVAAFRNHIMSPTDLAERFPDLDYVPIRATDFQGIPWRVLATYPSDSSGKILFLPHDMSTMLQFYRKDLYDSKGLQPPKTWNDYFSGMKTISNTGQVPFGSVCEAAPTVGVVYEYLNHLASFGGQLWQVNGNEIVSALGSDASLAALENYAQLRQYADGGSYTYDWTDIVNDVSKGVVANALEWYDYSYVVNDPLRSLVTGKIGYSPNPAGPAGSFSTYGGSGLGVSRYSAHPEAAWLWLQWATASGTQEALVLDNFHTLPSRVGILEKPEVRDALGGDAYQSLQVARSLWENNQITTLLPFPKWTSALDILSLHLSKAFVGQEAPTLALEQAMMQISSLGKLTF